MTAVITLQPRLDLTQARPLAEQISRHAGADLTIDAGQVEYLGRLAVQVLLAAGQDWARAGHRLTVAPCSDGFAAALASFGLTERFTMGVPA